MTGILNTLILALSLAATWLCLWAASHLETGYALLAVWLFSLVANTPFALMHEAVHGIGCSSRRANELLGIVAGWAFPTSFSMQRVAHEGHHRRNRTDLELYDYYLPGQSKWVRNLWLYLGNLLGLYWWSVLFGNLVYLVAPCVPLALLRRTSGAGARFRALCRRSGQTAAVSRVDGNCAGVCLSGRTDSFPRPQNIGRDRLLLGICPALVGAAICGSRLERA